MVKIGSTGGVDGVSKIYDVGEIETMETVKGEKGISAEKIQFERVLFEKFIGMGKTPSLKGVLKPPVPKKINVESLSGDENRMILRRFLLKENGNFKDLSTISFKPEDKEKIAKLRNVAEMVSLLNKLSKLHDSILVKLVVDKNV